MSDIKEEDLPMTLDEALPFLVLCKDWENKDLNFIIHSLNALCGKTTWELLTKDERMKLVEWLKKNNETDPRWEPLMKDVVS